eukprot:m.226501 g.226501  ORF g.226501 m.226501 type:complete len:93 (+) comp33493_c4_seq2:840-1118(+)
MKHLKKEKKSKQNDQNKIHKRIVKTDITSTHQLQPQPTTTTITANHKLPQLQPHYMYVRVGCVEDLFLLVGIRILKYEGCWCCCWWGCCWYW